MRKKAYLKATASYLPAGKLTNEDLAREFGDWNAAKIEAKTGIAVRSVASPGECASDLGMEAARRLFESGACVPADVDFLLLCTQTPDYFLPATACTLQARLGLPTSCGALDFNQGCSGFVYGVSLAKGLIESEMARNVLLITAETYSKFIHPKDRGTRTLFGDGAAATLIGAADSTQDLLGPFVFGTDGSGASNLIVRGGGMRYPDCPRASDATAAPSDGNLYMNGPELFNFTIRAVPPLCSELLTRAGLALSEVDYFVFHQANQFMLEHLRKKLAIPTEKFCINLKTYGNTVSATIPMALEAAQARGELRSGQRVMLVGFGVGYSWAAGMVRVP